MNHDHPDSAGNPPETTPADSASEEVSPFEKLKQAWMKNSTFRAVLLDLINEISRVDGVPTSHTWNYRVIEFEGQDGPYRAIHEVHYTDGVPRSYSERPTEVAWGSGEHPRQLLQQLELAINKPILLASDFSPSAREADNLDDEEFSGVLDLDISPDLHREAALSAARARKNLDEWIADAIRQELVRTFVPPRA